MGFPLRATLNAFRSDPLPVSVRVVGADMNGAGASFAVGQYADPRSSAYFVQGLALVSVRPDEDGRLVSVFQGVVPRTTMQALPLAGEVGDDLALFYDVQVDPLPLGGGFPAVETTIAFGILNIRGSVNA